MPRWAKFTQRFFILNAMIALSKIYGWVPKCETVAEDIRSNRLSFSTGKPITVSKLENGCYFLMDGYHRVMEAIRAGKTHIDEEINPHLPRIERTGGAYASYLSNKIAIATFMERKNG